MATTPVSSVRRGLRLDEGILAFDFKPSLGISARNIDKLGIDIRSFHEPLKRSVQQVMAPSFRKNFDSGGRPPWQPLADATIELRQRFGFGGSAPLIRTGLLRKTMGQLNIWQITQISATIKDLPNKIWYGKIHQAGYSGRQMSARTKRMGSASAALNSLLAEQRSAMTSGRTLPRETAPIPARPFVMFQEEDFDAIEAVFVRWLEERLAASQAKWGRG